MWLTLGARLLRVQVQQSAQAVCTNGQGHGLDSLLRVLHLVDLVIDTFEYPFGNPGSCHQLTACRPPARSFRARKAVMC